MRAIAAEVEKDEGRGQIKVRNLEKMPKEKAFHMYSGQCNKTHIDSTTMQQQNYNYTNSNSKQKENVLLEHHMHVPDALCASLRESFRVFTIRGNKIMLF